MIIRAKTKGLFVGKSLTQIQQNNSDRNIAEIDQHALVLQSMPRRLFFELTNTCNLNCVMCGRNSADFKPTFFQMEWFHYLEQFFDIVEEVTLMGWGEPTVHPNFVEMLRIINRHSARKYFCTNGMRLDKIEQALFDYNVDVFGVSVDGALAQTNNRIRRGSDLDKIVTDLERIVTIKGQKGVKSPHINFVFCAMKSNLHELSKLVELAANIGLEEVKVVYLTAFDDRMRDEVLWDCEEMLRREFNKAEDIAKKHNILLKLPHIPGEDPSCEHSHKDCYVAYRDFFVGSDGYVRPCMSSPDKFFHLDTSIEFMDIWNSKEYQLYREITNQEENMAAACKKCYQSSHCNWNKRDTFIQTGNSFSPDWE